jgi:hypothetical protein
MDPNYVLRRWYRPAGTPARARRASAAERLVPAYLLRRLAWLLPTWLGITLVTFVAVHSAPGDPLAASGAEAELSRAARIRRDSCWRAEHLLDEPLWKQYLHFLGPFDLSPRGPTWLGGTGERRWHGLLAADLGDEFGRPGVSVTGAIARRLAVTAPLALCAVVLMFLFGVPLGVWSALRSGRAADRGLRGVLLALHALPVFWLGLVLVLVFGRAAWAGCRCSACTSSGPSAWAARPTPGTRCATRCCRSPRWCCRDWPIWRARRARRCSRCSSRISCAPRARADWPSAR